MGNSSGARAKRAKPGQVKELSFVQNEGGRNSSRLLRALAEDANLVDCKTDQGHNEVCTRSSLPIYIPTNLDLAQPSGSVLLVFV
jgi:hypothetical protein